MPLIKTKLIRISTKRALNAYTGLNKRQYEQLKTVFTAVLKDLIAAEQKAKAHLQMRQSGGGRKAVFETIDDKLLCILHYQKAYPTFDNLSIEYKTSRTTVHKAVHYYAEVLYLALNRLKVVPKRAFKNAQELLEALQALGSEIQQLIIDATERPYRRLKNKDERDALYSGKKKRYTMKNTVITTVTRWIFFLGMTTQGSMHDYELLKEEFQASENQRSWFETIELFVDLGYLGIDKDFIVAKLNIPHKKPRKSKENPKPQLTEEQLQYNKKMSQTRVAVEHAIGSMKFFNVLNHPFRNRIPDFEDLVIVNCAALHNLYLKLK
jgi:hypothetical protein